MLNKKYQVLLSKWMEDYIKLVAEKYDLNFSSAIRVHICLGILYVISILESEYKIDLQKEEILEFSARMSMSEERNFVEEEVHHVMSKIIFEARKAVEYRLSKEKKINNKVKDKIKEKPKNQEKSSAP